MATTEPRPLDLSQGCYLNLVLILDPNKAFDAKGLGKVMTLSCLKPGSQSDIKLMVVQLVLVGLPQIQHGKGVGFVYVCVRWGGYTSSPYSMFRNNVF